MSAPTTRTLTPDELIPGARLVSTTMLGSVADDVVASWAEHWDADRSHGALTADGALVGVARWFPTSLSVPGGWVRTGAVTSVAVLPTHRRQGHLRRLMRAQLEQLVDEQVPTAVLMAAEWPIYGHYGYAAAADGCRWEIDSAHARFLAAPTGTTTLVTPAELRPALEAVHDANLARIPGGIQRTEWFWERVAGINPWPGDKDDVALYRAAVWHDDDGRLGGAVTYSVREEWTRNRPAGRLEVRLLAGTTPEAERELWRHVCDVDWTTTVSAEMRSVDDPLPLWLTDGRMAAQLDRSDSLWARILSVPDALSARRATRADSVVVEVVDALDLASGRWAVELGPDGADVTATTESADVRLPVAALSAAYLGGTSVVRLHQTGHVDEESVGGVARLGALLSSPLAPWLPTHF